jgi:hypothetical protein
METLAPYRTTFSPRAMQPHHESATTEPGQPSDGPATGQFLFFPSPRRRPAAPREHCDKAGDAIGRDDSISSPAFAAAPRERGDRTGVAIGRADSSSSSAFVTVPHCHESTATDSGGGRAEVHPGRRPSAPKQHPLPAALLLQQQRGRQTPRAASAMPSSSQLDRRPSISRVRSLPCRAGPGRASEQGRGSKWMGRLYLFPGRRRHRHESAATGPGQPSDGPTLLLPRPPRHEHVAKGPGPP